MSGKTVFMFSGQGSQYYQMGKQLFDENPVFRQSMTQLDGQARDLCGASVVEAIYSAGKSQVFERTLLTHPAIFMVEYSLAQCLIHAGIEPELTLGASMGSFAAAAVGGHIAPADALEAVIAQAKAFEACCARGGMLAVLASPALYDEPSISQHSAMAGINFDGHFAVSGFPAKLDAIAATLRQRGLSSQWLAVSYAFHSSAIDAAEQQFRGHMRGVRRRQGHLPLACAEQAAVLGELPDDFFWRTVRRPMRFHDTVAHLERQGAHRYIDVGPSGTLATFVKYGLPASSASSAHALLTPFGRDSQNLAALLAAQQAMHA